jgi:cytidyltransferase-like protein
MNYFSRLKYYTALTPERIKTISVEPGADISSVNVAMQKHRTPFLLVVNKFGAFEAVIDKNKTVYSYPSSKYASLGIDDPAEPEDICRKFVENPTQDALIVVDKYQRIRKVFAKNPYSQGGFEFLYGSLFQAGYSFAAFIRFMKINKVALLGMNGISRLIYKDLKDNGIEVVKIYTHDGTDHLFDERRTAQFKYIEDSEYAEFDALINCVNSLDAHVTAAGKTRVIDARRLISAAEMYAHCIFPLLKRLESLNKQGVRAYLFFEPCLYRLTNASDHERDLWEYDLSVNYGIDKAKAGEKPWDTIFASETLSGEEWLSACRMPQRSYSDGTHTFLKGKAFAETKDKQRLFHVKDGYRVTEGSPNAENSFVFFGGANISGELIPEDERVIPACVRKMFSGVLPEANFRFYNMGVQGINYLGLLQQIDSFNFREKDICVVMINPERRFVSFEESEIQAFLGNEIFDTQALYARPHNEGEIFVNKDSLLSHIGCETAAKFIAATVQNHSGLSYMTVRNKFTDACSPVCPDLIRINYLPETTDYLHWVAALQEEHRLPDAENKKIAAVVLTADPFTHGHRHLCEQALHEADYLYVFITQEDKFKYPFEDRLTMAHQNLGDIPNIKVIASGEYFDSAKTFPEYFNKEKRPEQIVDATINMDCFLKIAEALNITMYFTAEEPEDPISQQALEQYSAGLPPAVQVITLPRLQDENGSLISAKLFRQMIAKGKHKEAQKIAPHHTYLYLKEKGFVL